MSEHDDKIDRARAQAEVIDERIGQTFAFLRDALDDPALLDAIPSGATLRFRDVEIGQACYRLTAYRTPRMRQWAAQVTGTSQGAAAEDKAADVPRHPARGATVAEALDALERNLRNAAGRTALAY